MPFSISLTRYGTRGWQWTVTDKDTDETMQYRTDTNGNGLWGWMEVGTQYYGGDPQPLVILDWCQSRSVYSYSLPYRRGSAWAKIRRELTKEQ